jgi:hypothetical protein
MSNLKISNVQNLVISHLRIGILLGIRQLEISNYFIHIFLKLSNKSLLTKPIRL